MNGMDTAIVQKVWADFWPSGFSSFRRCSKKIACGKPTSSRSNTFAISMVPNFAASASDNAKTASIPPHTPLGNSWDRDLRAKRINLSYAILPQSQTRFINHFLQPARLRSSTRFPNSVKALWFCAAGRTWIFILIEETFDPLLIKQATNCRIQSACAQVDSFVA